MEGFFLKKPLIVEQKSAGAICALQTLFAQYPPSMKKSENFDFSAPTSFNLFFIKIYNR